MKRQLLLIATGALALVAILAAPALAATTHSADQIGQNLGNTLKTWAGGAFSGVAALVGLPLLLKRQVAEGLVLLALAVIIGGFVFAPTEVKTVTTSFWHTLTNGV